MNLRPILTRLRLTPSPAARGERIAARHLRRHGYRILARNLRNRFGEIDILAQAPDGRTIVIVEVKTAERAAAADRPDALRPEVRVGVAKQRKLAAMASIIVRRYDFEDRPVRFDVIGVDLIRKGKPVVRHHEGAFESHL